MELFNEYRMDIADLLLRSVLGILFLAQGYDKLFGMGIRATEEGMGRAMTKTHLPKSMINMATIISSVLEFGGGILLLAGFWTVPALILLALDLVIVAAGMSLREPLWDMRYYWPRLVMLVVLLMFPAEHSRFSIDHLMELNAPPTIAG